MSVLTPIDMPYGNFSSIQNAYDESLTLLQKLLKVTQVLNDVINYINNGGTLPDPLGDNPLTDLTSQVNDLLTRMGNQETMWQQVNGSPSAKAGESIYVPNDSNIFGYMAEGQTKPDGGNWLNLITLEQNNIPVVGDFENLYNGSGQPLWIVSNTYTSIHGQSSPTFQKLNSDGSYAEAGRTLKHQGNSSYHFEGFANGDQVLPVNVYTTMNNISTVNLQFPQNSWDGSGYLIPRNGMYHFDVTLKIPSTAPVTAAGTFRVALYVVHADNSTTLSDIVDVEYNGTYGSPFKTASFKYSLSLNDRVYVQIKPLTSSLTHSNGSKIRIYGLGDTIQS